MKTKPTALIFGVTGQDGTYMAEYLLEKGYEVHGTSRDHVLNPLSNLKTRGIDEKIILHTVALQDFRSILRVLDQVQPHEIYNLSGQTSVQLSFEQPIECFESIATATLNILECVRLVSPSIKIFNAASSEIFGSTDKPATVNTPFRPQSPYAFAKAASYWALSNYRDAYNIFAVNGILFNHESPLRGARFVTRKIIRQAIAIKRGQHVKLKLGNIETKRDWGWSPDFVAAMWLMLQQDEARDYIVATGESHSIREFVSEVFSQLGMDWESHVEIDSNLFRTTDVEASIADISETVELLNWKSQCNFKELVSRLIAAELARIPQT